MFPFLIYVFSEFCCFKASVKEGGGERLFSFEISEDYFNYFDEGIDKIWMLKTFL